MDIAARLAALAEQLAAAGVLATIDPGLVHPPGAWIAARRLEPAALCGRRPLVADIYLIARDAHIPQALAALDEMLSTTLAALATLDGVEVDSIALDELATLPHGGGPLPAFRITLEID